MVKSIFDGVVMALCAIHFHLPGCGHRGHARYGGTKPMVSRVGCLLPRRNGSWSIFESKVSKKSGNECWKKREAGVVPSDARQFKVMNHRLSRLTWMAPVGLRYVVRCLFQVAYPGGRFLRSVSVISSGPKGVARCHCCRTEGEMVCRFAGRKAGRREIPGA